MFGPYLLNCIGVGSGVGVAMEVEAKTVAACYSLDIRYCTYLTFSRSRNQARAHPSGHHEHDTLIPLVTSG